MKELESSSTGFFVSQITNNGRGTVSDWMELTVLRLGRWERKRLLL